VRRRSLVRMKQRGATAILTSTKMFCAGLGLLDISEACGRNSHRSLQAAVPQLAVGARDLCTEE
jgi:hypothetical protein